MELNLHSPVRLHDMLVKYRDNFTFVNIVMKAWFKKFWEFKIIFWI
jgi:hypothetical protein